MDFKTFAKPLIRLMYPDMRNGEATRQLFIDISSYDDAGDNPLRNFQEPTCRGYLQEGKGISKIAGITLKCLDEEKFATKINDLPTSIINLLIDEYENFLPYLDSFNIGEKLAREFADILNKSQNRNGSSREDVSTDNHNANLALETELFMETRGKCPLCNAPISLEIVDKRFKTINITPSNVKKDYRIKRKYEDLVPKMPELGFKEDQIALCKNCATEYEKNPTPAVFARLVSQKRMYRAREEFATAISKLELETNLPVLLSRLGQVCDYNELEKISLNALRIKDKIDASDQLLTLKIETLATRYYYFIREQGRLLDAQGDLDFDLLANQVRCCYLTLRKSGFSQEVIFNRIRNWMITKTGCDKPMECEVLVAFFVQNCEVFDEITK